MNQKIFILLGIFILILATGLRFYQLGNVPVSLYWDEMAMLVDAKSVAQTGQDMHGRLWLQAIFPSYGDYKLPVYIWLAGIAVKLFGVSEWALRLPSALAGVATVLVAGGIGFELARRMGAKKAVMHLYSLAAMLVMAVSPWSIMFSRTGFEGHIAQLLVAISVWLLLLSDRKRWLVWLAALIGGLATYSYFSVRFVWPVVYIFYFILIEYQFWWQEIQKKHWIRAGKNIGVIIIGLTLFVMTLLPMIRSPFYADSNQYRLSTASVLNDDSVVIQSNIYREMAGNSSLDRLFFHRDWLRLQKLLENYADNVHPAYLFLSGDPNPRHGTGEFGLFLVVFLPFFLVGLYNLYDKNKRIFAFLIIWWLIALLPASVPEDTPHALRSLNALVPLSLLIGWGFLFAYQRVNHIKQVLVKAAVIAGVVFLIAINVLAFCYHYFVLYPVNSAKSWHQGYKEIVMAIMELREDKPTYIQGIDDKLYLWFMGYGPYQGADFAKWESQQFQFKKFDHVFFEVFPGWEDVENWDSKVVVAGTPEDIEQLIEREDMRLVDSRFIYTPEGNKKYVVVLVEKKL